MKCSGCAFSCASCNVGLSEIFHSVFVPFQFSQREFKFKGSLLLDFYVPHVKEHFICSELLDGNFKDRIF